MKDNSPGTIWPVVIIIGAVIAALILVCGVLAVGLMFFGTRSMVTSPPIALEEATIAVEQDPDVQPLVTPTATGGDSNDEPTEESDPPPSSQATDAETEAAMQAVEAVVADIRELEGLVEVPKAYLDPDDMQDIVINDFFEDYSEEDAADDAVFYAALDVIDLDFDVYAFYVDLYSEGIAGYYDPEKDEFFLIGDSSAFTASDEWTFAHEYIHALQDQHFDLVEFLHYNDDEWFLDNYDESLARSALIEGDASLGSAIYIGQGMSSDRQQALFEEYADAEIPEIYDRTPYFMLQDFFFPYDQGQAFVDYLYTQGGFDLVNEAYENPPASTEHILHPERYLDGEQPLIVTLLDTLDVLGSDYREIYTLPIGEWYHQLYLSQLIDLEIAEAAADGWGGDRMGIYTNDQTGEFVMVLRTRWDSASEATEFTRLFPQYGEAWSDSSNPALQDDGLTCWEADDLLCLLQSASDETLLIRGPDADTVQAIADTYR